MQTIEITPFVGCDQIRFGMTRDEVRGLLKEADRCPAFHWQGILPGHAVTEGQYQEPRRFRYDAARSSYAGYDYRILYVDNRVAEIGIYAPEQPEVTVSLYGVDLFQSTAEEVIAALEGHTACVWDTPDKALSYFYDFHDIAFRLWRESVFHPKLYEDESYMQDFCAMPPENREEELKYQYFQMAIFQTAALHEKEQTYIKSLHLP